MPCPRAAVDKPPANAPATAQQKIKVVGLRRKGSFIPLRVS
ncbi:MAG: hypothetical protein V5B34_06075 [Accumulibacter sp.]